MYTFVRMCAIRLVQALLCVHWWCGAIYCAMLPRPPSPFGVRFGEVNRLFNARPSISALELRDLCARDYHMDVSVGSIE